MNFLICLKIGCKCIIKCFKYLVQSVYCISKASLILPLWCNENFGYERKMQSLNSGWTPRRFTDEFPEVYNAHLAYRPFVLEISQTLSPFYSCSGWGQLFQAGQTLRSTGLIYEPFCTVCGNQREEKEARIRRGPQDWQAGDACGRLGGNHVSVVWSLPAHEHMCKDMPWVWAFYWI